MPATRPMPSSPPPSGKKNQLPVAYQSKTRVIPDFIDIQTVKPNPAASVHLHKANKTFHVGDEVITFVNRNLEPYRGFHSFMRALPAVLQARPQAHAILVGGQDVSYGKKHPSGQSWKQVMLQEVALCRFVWNLTTSKTPMHPSISLRQCWLQRIERQMA